MQGFKKAVLVICAVVGMSGHSVWAQDLTFSNITDKDVENIVSDFTGIYTHTSMSGAGTLGSIFGFEVGLVAGLSSADQIQKIVKREDSSADDLPVFPSGGLLGRVSVPFGITVEALIIPEIGTDDFKFNNMSAAVMWTPTSTLLSFLPFSLAVKAHYTKTDISFKIPDVNNSSVDVDTAFENTIMGAQVLASMNLLVVEPYVGLGVVSGDGSLTYKGTGTIYDTSYTSSNTASKTVSGTQMLVGAELKLLLLKIGAEYSRQLDVDRYGLKFSAFF